MANSILHRRTVHNSLSSPTRKSILYGKSCEKHHNRDKFALSHFYGLHNLWVSTFSPSTLSRSKQCDANINRKRYVHYANDGISRRRRRGNPTRPVVMQWKLSHSCQCNKFQRSRNLFEENAYYLYRGNWSQQKCYIYNHLLLVLIDHIRITSIRINCYVQ